MNNLQDKKDALFKVINPYFNEIGYTFSSKTPNKFYKDTDNIRYELSFNFLTRSNNHTNTLLLLHYKEVERIILSIGVPNNKLNAHKQGDAYMITIKHPYYYDIYASKFNQLDLSSVDGFRKWGELIIAYMEGEGKKFIEHYSYLPNVLLEMNRLEEQGKYWNEILVGLADYDFRGLIISKLCNDPDFNKKIQSRDSLFYNIPQLSDWIPYYGKLKEVLEDTKPQYNIEM